MNAAAGFLAGIAASMGLGGGFILVIYLAFFLGLSQVQSQAANLVFFLPIALISIIIHTKNKLIDWRIIPPAVITGVITAFIGTYLGTMIDDALLRKLFGGLILLVGIKELFHRSNNKKQRNKPV